MPGSLVRTRRLAHLVVFLVALIAAALAARPAAAQISTPAPAAAAPGSNLRISLLTMGPGDAIWELFGHNALVVEDLATGERLAYNWGLFDFSEEDFFPNFIRGAMRYWMAGIDYDITIASYRQAGRDLYLQELNLTPAQRQELREFVEWNALPENRFYRYDYFLDNCSTRVRDAIDRAVNGTLRSTLDSIATGTTFRWHSRRLTQVQPPSYLGIEIGLGSPTDHPISAWEESFLPMQLREHVRRVQIIDASGVRVPLVASDVTLFDGPAGDEPAAPPRWWPIFLSIGLLVAGGLVLLIRRAEGRVDAAGSAGAAAAWLAWIGAAWSVVAGLAGILLAFLWLGTAHTATHWNANLLLLNPLSLILVVAFPRYVRRGGGSGVARPVAVMVATLAIAGALVLVIPGARQYVHEMVALALPIHLALAWAALRLAHNRAVPGAAAA